MLREIDGNNVNPIKNKVDTKNNILVFFINLILIVRPTHKAIMPTHKPHNCLLTKKSDVPNVSSAYTELAEYTNKHPMSMNVVMIIKKTRKSAYRDKFFDII